MIWNNNYLEYDQVGFQKIVYVGVHITYIVDSWDDTHSGLFFSYVW